MTYTIRDEDLKSQAMIDAMVRYLVPSREADRTQSQSTPKLLVTTNEPRARHVPERRHSVTALASAALSGKSSLTRQINLRRKVAQSVSAVDYSAR